MSEKENVFCKECGAEVAKELHDLFCSDECSYRYATRDDYAAAALTGLLSNSNYAKYKSGDDSIDIKILAKDVHRIAEAVLIRKEEQDDERTVAGKS